MVNNIDSPLENATIGWIPWMPNLPYRKSSPAAEAEWFCSRIKLRWVFSKLEILQGDDPFTRIINYHFGLSFHIFFLMVFLGFS